MRQTLLYILLLLCATVATAQVPTPTGNTKVRVFEGNNAWIASLNELIAGRVGPDSTWVKYSGAYTGKRIGDYVYRNGPISLGRRDTTARLYILEKTVPANNLGGALVIQGVSNGDSINYFIRLKSSAKDSTEDFLIGTINSGPISDPGDNTSWWFGQNFLPGGSKQRMSESASGWVIEDKFENSLPIVGLAASTEMHWMYSPERTPDEPDSTSDQVRVISCALDHLGRTNDLGVHADRFYINRFGDVLGYRPAKGPQWAEGDFYNKKWTWYDSLTVIYETPQVNVPFMRFRAADNSRYWKIFEPDASDRLVLNPEGNDLYTFAPNLIFNTQATITTNDAAAIQIGKSALPAALSVYSSGTGVITMKNSAETTGWTHRVSATEFDIQTPGGNAPLIIHESAPQSAVYVKSDGDVGIGTGGPTARAHLYTTSGATKSMLKVENSTGVNQMFRSDATPESAITGSPGDLTIANVSSTGKIYLKETGVGNTGWKELLTSGNGALGSGAANQVTYWTGANTIAGSANMTWDGTTQTVTGKGVFAVGNTFGANARGVDMSGNMTSNGNSVSLEALRTSVTFANSGAETGNNFRGIYTPTVTAGSTAGVHAGIWTAPTNSSTGITSFYGLFGGVTESSASGNLSSRYAGFLSMDKSSNENTTHSGVGIKGRIRDQSTAGRWSTAYGLESEVTNGQNAYGVYVGTSNSRGTGNNVTGVRIGSTVSGSGVVADAVKGVDLTFSETSSGSVTTYYGLYCAASAAATTNYLLYNTTDFRSYLNGSLSLGVNVTTAKLFVRGTGATSSTYAQIIEKSDGTDYFVARDDGKVGIGNNTTLARELHVTGEARITDLVTDTPTKIVGADADGDLDTVGIGAEAELHITSGTLGTNFHTTISPSQITSDQNNWNPTGLATAWIIRVDADASFRSITGITAPSFNKRLTLHNVSANAVLLPTEFPSSTAANRFAFGRDVVLFPGKSVEIIYDVTTARWRLVATAGIYADVEHLYFNTSFNAPVSVTAGDFDFFNITSAATATKVSPVAGRNSGVAVNTGSSATGLGYVASKDVYFVTNNSSGTASWAYCKAVVKTPASLSDGSNDYTLRIGFNATTGDGTADGAYFDYNHSNVSGNWGCNTTNASNVQRNNSGVAVAAATVYVLEVVLRPNLTAAFFINGTQVATNDTFVPSGDALLVLSEIQKSIGTTQRDLTVYTLQTSVATVK